MNQLLEQAQQLAIDANKLSRLIKHERKEVSPAVSLITELSQLVFEHSENQKLLLSLHIDSYNISSQSGVIDFCSHKYIKENNVGIRVSLQSPTLVDELLTYRDQVLANINLAQQQVLLQSEQYA
ncbi:MULTISPECIES: hypothetical protein [Photobacterium]|uniref:hypothetical protein n=1 Tax=Photobacterium TaxID=657 RepID=UPI0007F8B701|nr:MULTISPECIES: hypothetical protein [Photobacterium]OBU37431.1 hypothetical protein AYY24_11445 [Photobacterium phosphoreum]PST95729.1 hypothetical protein C9I87_08765 [Photobacterium iliopiscarium]PSW38014.1 hypothetical protein CTM87_05570 [Photobacterium phosphoreum]